MSIFGAVQQDEPKLHDIAIKKSSSQAINTKVYEKLKLMGEPVDFMTTFLDRIINSGGYYIYNSISKEWIHVHSFQWENRTVMSGSAFCSYLRKKSNIKINFDVFEL